MIHFTVHGKAAPAGSKRGFIAGGKVRMTDMSKRAPLWKQEVKQAALAAYKGPLLEGPISISIHEYRLRPKSHMGKKGLNKKGRETPYPVSAPDCLKIARAIEDALSKVVYRDDAQIVRETISKKWGDKEQTLVWIREVSEETGNGGSGVRATEGDDSPVRSDAHQRPERSDRGGIPHLG